MPFLSCSHPLAESCLVGSESSSTSKPLLTILTSTAKEALCTADDDHPA